MKKIILILILSVLISGCSPKCPDTCNDNNPCTNDVCDEETNYQCTNSPVNGKQPGCSADITCGSKICKDGVCEVEYKIDCCGNGVCETGEDYTSCSRDCPDCGVDNACKTNTRFDYHKQECVSDVLIPCCGNDICDEGDEEYSNCPTDCPNCDDDNNLTEDSFNYITQKCENTELLIEEAIGDYKYVESMYGGGPATAGLYSEEGEQIGTIKCGLAVYKNSAGQETGATVCPYDNRQDVTNSLEGMSIKYGFVLGEYKGEKVYRMDKEVIIWTNNVYLLTSGAEPGSGVLPVELIIDAYLKKYPNDLS